MLRQIHPARRRGVAAIEMGFVTMMFVAPLIIGIWEVGRFIHVQQVVGNSAREGARLAAQGFTIKPDGTSVQIMKATGTPNVQDAVYDYLRAAGFTTLARSDVTVNFKFIVAAGYNDGLTEPYQGAKNQPFEVTVTVPWNKVRWINLGILRPADVHFKVSWRMMIDDAFTINETLPSW